jgi:hypothetical protein
MDPATAVAAGGLRWKATVVAAVLCLAACQAEPPSAAAPSQPAAATTQTGASGPAPARLPVVEPAASRPMPPVSPEDVDFAGWFIDRDGSDQLLACGQSVPLPIENPAFLRELRRKLGSGSDKPVYVRLRVRLAAGSRVEVTEVLQFGVDETPVVGCVLNQ